MKETFAVRVGTRKSNLACQQAAHVVDLLTNVQPSLICKIKTMLTEGDRRSKVPLIHMSGRGVFTNQIEDSLKAGKIDIAVHSLKDLPIEEDPDLCLAAVPARGDPRECLISSSGASLFSLPPGAVVGTSSTRREAQLRALRPDLVFRPIRGNVDTRICKVLEGSLYDAILLAASGIKRLNLDHHVSEWLSLDRILPAPGQGALAIQCRKNDFLNRTRIATIDNPHVRASVTAERMFLAELGGGCAFPIAAFANWVENTSGGEIHFKGAVFSSDGKRQVSVNGVGDSARELGRSMAHQALKLGAGSLGLIRSIKRLTHPLLGKRIVVTRAVSQAQYLTDKLQSLGANPLNLPLVRIATLPKPETLKDISCRLDEYDWVVFTSVNCVKSWLQLVPNPKLNPAKTKIAAVGSRTAAQLSKGSLRPSLVPPEFSKEHLVKEMGDVQGLQILLPRGELAGPELLKLLQSRGARVDEIILYQTLPVVPDQEQLDLIARGIDAVLFTSSSTVRNFVAVLNDFCLSPSQLQGAIIVCIGPATARTAVELGLISSGLDSGENTIPISKGSHAVPVREKVAAIGIDSVKDVKELEKPIFSKLIIAKNFTTEGVIEALIDYYQD